MAHTVPINKITYSTSFPASITLGITTILQSILLWSWHVLNRRVLYQMKDNTDNLQGVNNKTKRYWFDVTMMQVMQSQVTMRSVTIWINIFFRIELAATTMQLRLIYTGCLFKCNWHQSLVNGIILHEPPLQDTFTVYISSSNPILWIRIMAHY